MIQTQPPLPEKLFWDIDRSGRIPLYSQISSRIEGAILSGELPPGARLENENALSRRLGLSLATLRHAIRELVEKGLVVKSPGIGTRVVHGGIARNSALTGRSDELARVGQRPRSQVLIHEVTDAPLEVAAALGLGPGSAVFHLRRLRFADEVPFAVLENYLPERFAAQLSPGQLERNGLYQLLEQGGTTMRVAKQKIGARQCTEEEGMLLGLDAGAAVLSESRTSYDKNGMSLELGRHSYRSDLHSFDMTILEK